MKRLLLCGLVTLGLAGGAEGGTRTPAVWSVQFALGGAFNFRTPLTVRQEGAEDLRFGARYGTRAFRFPIYYAVRIGRSAGTHALSLELLHHKLYLENPPGEIRNFSISHGYNLLTVNHAWRVGGAWTGGGLGLVIAHPENTVRGRRLGEHGGPLGGGYYAAGPTAAVFVRRDVPLGSRLTLPLETRFTGSWARVPIVDGSAVGPNFALHATAGIGWRER